jgi:hypothetical protein
MRERSGGIWLPVAKEGIVRGMEVRNKEWKGRTIDQLGMITEIKTGANE